MDYAETIVAVSSAAGGLRSVVRITGPDALNACTQVFSVPISLETNGILAGSVEIQEGLRVDAQLYLFFAPRSYTGEDMAELHVFVGDVLVEALVQRLLDSGLRAAGPGEFTARAYLNGKLDLAQAEAVNEIIAGSNRFQLQAAERLLSGRLSQSAGAIRSALLECLSLIEAGLDFSGEEIEFISPDQATERLNAIATDLEELLSGSIRYESLLNLPAIGIAGAPNAGKSSLLNRLLGQDRSIVSDQPRTTRDVLSGLLTTDRFACVLFDCAGLLAAPETLIDRLAQQAAIEALRHSRAVLFCVDVAKNDWSEDLAVRTLIESEQIVFVATKSDLLPAERLNTALDSLNTRFGAPFLPVSALAGSGLDALRDRILASSLTPEAHDSDTIAMTTRHKQSVSEALANVREAASHVEHGDDEVAATLIRAAHDALTAVDQQPLDEQVLDHIFSRFCIGK